MCTNSDGTLSPANLAGRYQTLGYNFLFITDHNYITPVTNLSGSGFLCIAGEEITFGRHFNGLGIQRYVKPVSNQYSIDSVKTQFGIATFNHPFWFSPRVYSKEILEIKGLEFIEIHNALTDPGSHDNQMLWDSLLTAGKLIYGIASDDAHGSEHIGKGWIMVQSPALQKDSLMRAMQKGKFYSSTGVLFTDITVTQTKISVAVPNVATIKFIGESGKIFKTINGNGGEYLLSGKEWYVRIEAANVSGQKGWSQPLVWNENFGGRITGGSNIIIGSPTASLNLMDFDGTIICWQKRLNNGEWITIPSSAATTFSETPQTTGIWEYRVEVQRSNGKTAWAKSALVEVKVVTEVNSEVLSDFIVYPNPTSGYLHIKCPEQIKDTHYSVYDLLGKMVISGELSKDLYGEFKINLSNLNGGYYIIKSIGGQTVKVLKNEQ